MTTAIAVAKALVALVAAIGFVVFAIRKKAWTSKLEAGATKAQQTGDTSDVENLFGGPPPDGQ